MTAMAEKVAETLVQEVWNILTRLIVIKGHI